MTHPDSHAIVRRLHVGSAPPPGDYSEQFDAIYLVGDYQPEAKHFPNVEVHNLPFDDSHAPTRNDLHIASEASRRVARDLSLGKRVLVTCRMGRNRSALVAALALKRLAQIPGRKAYELVRSRRVDRTGVRALENPTFARMLVNLP
jgi:protein-tyrosine phosphatase